MTTAVILLAAWLLDALLSEPRRGHPLAAFGGLAARLEQRLNQPHYPAARRRLSGAGALAGLILPAVLLIGWLSSHACGWFIELLTLLFCLGGHSLRDHALAVARALRQARGSEALDPARRSLTALVSRATSSLEPAGIAAAATESVLENGNDAVFATLFWFVVGGAPGALAHRLVNTLDAMWGYRTQRFTEFGWAAARLDDLLGWLPARLTGLTYALLAGRPVAILRRARQQARYWPGVNPGLVLASGALALRVKLGGPAPYPDGVHDRPWLGETPGGSPGGATKSCCAAPDNSTIVAAWRLLRLGVWLWLGVILGTSIGYAYVLMG